MILKFLIVFYRWIWGLPAYVAGSNPIADSAFVTMSPAIDITVVSLALIWVFARRGERGKK